MLKFLIALPSWGNKSAVVCSSGFQPVENPLIRNSSSANQLLVKSSEIFLTVGMLRAFTAKMQRSIRARTDLMSTLSSCDETNPPP